MSNISKINITLVFILIHTTEWFLNIGEGAGYRSLSEKCVTFLKDGATRESSGLARIV